VISLRATGLKIKKFYMVLALCWVFVLILEQTATFSLYIINWVAFITVVESVYSAVRTGSLNKGLRLVFTTTTQTLEGWVRSQICAWICLSFVVMLCSRFASSKKIFCNGQIPFQRNPIRHQQIRFRNLEKHSLGSIGLLDLRVKGILQEIKV